MGGDVTKMGRIGRSTDDRGDGHHFWPYPLHGALHNRCAQVLARERAALTGAAGAPLGQRVVEINQHDDAGLGGDTSERNEADGDGDAHVEMHPGHQPHAADQGEGHRQHDD